MPVVFRTDSDNVVHQIWAQEQANSCAVASIWMARNQAKQMTFNQDEWSLAWRLYGSVVQGMALVPPAPPGMTLNPATNPAAFPGDQSSFGTMFASTGTYMGQVVQALQNDGLRVNHNTGFGPGKKVNPNWLGTASPAIILLGWYNGTTRAGGHFIVATRVASNGRIVYLDPWEGRLRERDAGPSYIGNGIFENIVYISS